MLGPGWRPVDPFRSGRVHSRSGRASFVVGVLFPALSFGQAFTRSGFDLRRHALSSLTLGDLGFAVGAVIISGWLVALSRRAREEVGEPRGGVSSYRRASIPSWRHRKSR
ncbi:hypothetical protein [Micromonospora sp. NPDC049301]|uniref:hypothetical protein n=1 Tax=Micromonospora sp. NPDC049301 TaxID=3155723 RepID=UPI00341326F9